MGCGKDEEVGAGGSRVVADRPRQAREERKVTGREDGTVGNGSLGKCPPGHCLPTPPSAHGCPAETGAWGWPTRHHRTRL